MYCELAGAPNTELERFGQVGHVPPCIFGSIQHRSAPRTVFEALFDAHIAPNRHKQVPPMANYAIGGT